MVVKTFRFLKMENSPVQWAHDSAAALSWDVLRSTLIPVLDRVHVPICN